MQSIILAKKHRFTGPGNFEEISQAQLVTIMRVQRTIPGEILQAMELAHLIFKIPAKLINKLTDAQVMQLISIWNFVYMPTICFEKWIIKKLPGLKLYGPSDSLDNISFDELMHADQALDAYKDSEDEQHLDELVAVLYRPKTSRKLYQDTGDIRILFNKNHLSERAKTIRKTLDIDVKQAIRFNYIACRAVMAMPFVHLFPEADDEEIGDKKASNGNWLDVSISLARKEPVLGNFHDIERDNAYLVLKVLDQVMKDYKEQMAEIEKRK